MRAIETTIPLDAEAAEAAIRSALSEQGFGVITEIDFAATLKAKLGVDREPLKVLGACNPGFAKQALEIDPSVALLLPCNVAIAPAEGGGTRISVVDPREMIPDAEFKDLARVAAEQLQAAVDTVATEHGYDPDM